MGSYTCEVITQNDQQVATTFLTVLYAPRMLDRDYEGKFPLFRFQFAISSLKKAKFSNIDEL